jgi:hypothetical protein
LAWLALRPAIAQAQSAIAGSGQRHIGAIMPGVTVEASSPARLNRFVVATDEQGQHKIVDLCPGITP